MKHDSTIVVVTGQRFAELLRNTRNSFLQVLRMQPVSEAYLSQSMFIIEQFAQFCEHQEPAHPWFLRKQYLAQRADLRAKYSYSRSYLDTDGRQLRHFLRWYVPQVYAGNVSWGQLSPQQLEAYWATEPTALSYRRTILTRHREPLMLWLKRQSLESSHEIESLLHDYFEERRRAMRGNGYGFVLSHRSMFVTRRHLAWLEQQGHLPAGTATQGAVWSGAAKIGATEAKHGKSHSQSLQQYFVVKVDSDLPHALRQPLVEYVEHLIHERELAKRSIDSIVRTNLVLCRKLSEAGCESFTAMRVCHLDDVVSSLVSSPQHDIQRRRQQVQAHHTKLRGFLRFLYQQGVLERQLAQSLISPPTYRFARPHRVLSEKQVQELLNSVDRSQPSGRRCYAILMLITTYGLRPIDVSLLRVDDVNWREKHICLQELSNIEQAMQAKVQQARTAGHRFGRQTQQAAIELLRDCGLRVSEACHLNMTDYDPQQRSLRIERTKFFKTRVIPLPRSTCIRLNRYLEHRRRWLSPTNESPALFISILRRRLERGGFETPFNQLLTELSIYQPRRQQGRSVFGSTNLHALRHTYAVRALERWQLQGRNVEHLLPLLSAYMGHVHISYTTHYLHLTPVLMHLANERFAQLASSRLEHCDGAPHGQ